MADPRTERFIAALRTLEADEDVERIAALFAGDAELRSPTHDRTHRGPAGARHFWDAYRRSFAEIHSEFRNIIDTDGAAVLEWESRGRTTRGGAVRYSGVSILEFDGDAIRSFRSYFDRHELGEELAGRRPGGE